MSQSTRLPYEGIIQLLRNLKANPETLPQYEEVVLRQCLDYITKLHEENVTCSQNVSSSATQIQSDLATGSSASTAESDITSNMIHSRETCINYMKRCCCAYIFRRMKMIKNLRWKHGGAIPNSIKAHLSTKELEWLTEYNNIVAEYQRSLGQNGLNLMSSLEPPRKLYVHVRALKDCGEYETSDGTVILLNKDSSHMISAQDCDLLVKQGILEVIDD